MLRKFVGVGFHSSPGEGTRAVMTGCHENPSARGAYMLRKFVGVGFHSSPGEGARAVMTGCQEKTLPPAAWGTLFEKTVPLDP
jgi:hypothetical protein